jgi:hypothetical protein
MTTPDHTPAHPQARQRQQWGGQFPPNPTYSPNLAPSNFRLFGPLALPGQHFADSSELKQACMKSFKISAKSFMQPEYSIS